jgi:hypothetical protein
MTLGTSTAPVYLAESVDGGVLRKDRGCRAALDAAGYRTLRPALVHYVIARRAGNGLRLLHVPLGFGEEALVLFSSREAAQGYYSSRRRFLSEVFSEEWYERECSSGELVSLLLGPYEAIESVLLDPPAGVRFVAGSAQADLMSRETLIHRLLDQPRPTPQRRQTSSRTQHR